MRRTQTGRRPRRGFALIAALWLMVMISSVALDLALAARSRRMKALNTVDGARARGAARAGLAHARARLDQAIALTALLGTHAANNGDAWSPPDSLLPGTESLGGDPDAHYQVTLRDAGTLLNLNAATEDELRRLFAALHIDEGESDRLAQCIMDWRDPDDFRRARGAETDDYLRVGARALPTNGPFRTLGELRDVMGMTPEVYALVRPYLTLVGSAQVNLNGAPDPVLYALPGMTDEAVSVLHDARLGHRPVASLDDLANRLSPNARSVLEAAMPQLAGQVGTQATEVIVESVGWVEGSPVVARGMGVFDRSGTTVIETWERVE